MSFLTFLTTFIKFLPEMVKLIGWISEKVEQGIKEQEIKKSIVGVTKAFDLVSQDPQQAAKELDEIFIGYSVSTKRKLQK